MIEFLMVPDAPQQVATYSHLTAAESRLFVITELGLSAGLVK